MNPNPRANQRGFLFKQNQYRFLLAQGWNIGLTLVICGCGSVPFTANPSLPSSRIYLGDPSTVAPTDFALALAYLQLGSAATPAQLAQRANRLRSITTGGLTGSDLNPVPSQSNLDYAFPAARIDNADVALLLATLQLGSDRPPQELADRTTLLQGLAPGSFLPADIRRIPGTGFPAAGFSVNSTVDAVDANPGDGLCRTAASTCTLRAAIQEANARPGSDFIGVPTGVYTLTRAGSDDTAANGDLDVTEGVTLVGSGVTETILDGGGLDRLLDIRSNGQVAIQDLTVQNGLQTVGGGIQVNPLSRLLISGVRVQQNQATDPSIGGGGLYNQGIVTVFDSSFLNNQANNNGGGIYGATESEFIATNSQINSNASLNSGGGLFASNAAFTLKNSQVNQNTAGSNGGGIRGNGGTTLINSTVNANTAEGTAGIYSFGPLTLQSSQVSLNVGPGIRAESGNVTVQTSLIQDNQGRGIGNFGSSNLTVLESEISGNQAVGEGGGISSRNSLVVRNSFIHNNSATTQGGGLFASGGSVQISGSTLSQNTAQESGGGIYSSATQVQVINSTLNLNQATTQGGGVFFEAGNLAILFSTVSSNQAQTGSSLYWQGAGVTTKASILFRESTTAPNCGFSSPQLLSTGYTLSSDGSCSLSAVGDQSGVNPQLNLLAENGGSTPTQSLKTNSPALNTVPVADCIDNTNTAVSGDQRGVPRPQGSGCDLGAFEKEP